MREEDRDFFGGERLDNLVRARHQGIAGGGVGKAFEDDDAVALEGFLLICREAHRNAGSSKAAQFARVELIGAAVAQDTHGLKTDLQVLADAFAVHDIGHAAQFDFAVDRFVGDHEKRAVGDAKAEPVAGDGGRLHVDGDGTRLAEAAEQFVEAQLPVAVVGGGHSAGPHAGLERLALQAGDAGDGLLEGNLHFGDGRDGDPFRQVLVQNMIFAHVGVGKDVVAQPLGAAQAGTMAEHQPGMRAQDGDMIGDGFGVAGADADIDQRDALPVGSSEMVGGHLRQAREGGAAGGLIREAGVGRDDIARFDQEFVVAALADFLLGVVDELVDVALVVGEEDEALEVIGLGGGVMRQAVQREIDTLGGEQREREGVAGLGGVGVVGDRIIDAARSGNKK